MKQFLHRFIDARVLGQKLFGAATGVHDGCVIPIAKVFADRFEAGAIQFSRHEHGDAARFHDRMAPSRPAQLSLRDNVPGRAITLPEPASPYMLPTTYCILTQASAASLCIPQPP